MANMGMGLQSWSVRRALEKRGIDPEAVDVDAHLDDSLSYRENLDNLQDATGLSLSSQAEEDKWRRWEHEEHERAAFGGEDPYSAEAVPVVPVAQVAAAVLRQVKLTAPLGPVVQWPHVVPVKEAPWAVRRALANMHRTRTPRCCIIECTEAPYAFAVSLARTPRSATLAFGYCKTHRDRAPPRAPLVAAEGFAGAA